MIIPNIYIYISYIYMVILMIIFYHIISLFYLIYMISPIWIPFLIRLDHRLPKAPEGHRCGAPRDTCHLAMACGAKVFGRTLNKLGRSTVGAYFIYVCIYIYIYKETMYKYMYFNLCPNIYIYIIYMDQ